MHTTSAWYILSHTNTLTHRIHTDAESEWLFLASDVAPILIYSNFWIYTRCQLHRFRTYNSVSGVPNWRQSLVRIWGKIVALSFLFPRSNTRNSKKKMFIFENDKSLRCIRFLSLFSLSPSLCFSVCQPSFWLAECFSHSIVAFNLPIYGRFYRDREFFFYLTACNARIAQQVLDGIEYEFHENYFASQTEFSFQSFNTSYWLSLPVTRVIKLSTRTYCHTQQFNLCVTSFPDRIDVMDVSVIWRLTKRPPLYRLAVGARNADQGDVRAICQ